MGSGAGARWMRRGVAGWLAWAVATTAWAAPETITLYYWGNEHEEVARKFAPELIEAFEAEHDGRDGRPAIKVIMGQSASFNKTDDPQRLLCGIAGGDPPDVVFFDRFAVGEWAKRGAFTNLQPFLERDLRERPDDPRTLRPEMFYEPCWEEANYEGQLYAVPADTDNRALYFNLDLMEKHADALIAAGCVDPADPTKVGPPRTWDQLKAAAQILTERDAAGNLVRVGFIPNYGNAWLYMYGWLNGGEFMSDDGRTCTLNSPEIVEALAYMTELYELLGGAEALTAFQSSQEGSADLNLFLTDKIAMKIDGDVFIQEIANYRPDMRFGTALAPAPEGKQRLGWCGGWCWVIPKNASHPEAAWTFIKYLASQEAYRRQADALAQVARSSGNVFIPRMSSRRDITEWAMDRYVYNVPDLSPMFKEAKRVFVDAMPISKYRPVTPVGQLLWNEQVRGMEGGYYLRYNKDNYGENAQIALDRSTRIVQQELDRFYAPPTYPEISWTPVVVSYGILLIAGLALIHGLARRRHQARGYFRQEARAGYVFAAPWFIGFIVFWGGPIVFSFVMSLCEYDIFNPPRFVGLKQYAAMLFHEPRFWTSLWNTLYMACAVPLYMAAGLGIALLLNHEIRGMAIYRTFFFLPSIMPAVAASILWIWIFNPQEGVLNNALAQVGIPGPAWLQDQQWSKPALVLMGLWGAGGGMIVWLAGLKGIPRQLYEAAEIDGAGVFRRFWNVTLPMLSPYIFFNLVMGLIMAFQIFTQAYIMTQGGPVDSTLFYAYELFNNAFRYMRMGYASAMAWVLFGVILALTLIQIRLAPRWVHYGDEQ